MLNIQAFQVADDLQINQFKKDFTAEPISATNWELFYALESNRYLYLFHYGVVVFAGYDEVSKSDFLRFLKHYAEDWIDNPFQEEFVIEVSAQAEKFNIKNEKVVIPEKDFETSIPIIMLNTAQSVSLDYYEKLTDDILNSTQQYVKLLENYGQIKVSKNNLLKFIGRTLNVKNSIVDNLYILDNPNTVWEDINLDLLNKGMRQEFEIYPRFKALDYRLEIVQNNLKLFTEILQHRESSRLEWIIIALILIEVINLIWKEILGF